MDDVAEIQETVTTTTLLSLSPSQLVECSEDVIVCVEEIAPLVLVMDMPECRRLASNVKKKNDSPTPRLSHTDSSICLMR